MKKYNHVNKLHLITYCILFTILMYKVVQPTIQINARKDFSGLRPQQCIGSPELLYRFCCAIPPFFTQQTARLCGGVANVFYLYENVTGILRRAFDCGYWYCVLDKYELLTEKGFVDNDKYFVHLDLWVSLNPLFRGVMLDAKVECKSTLRYYLPLKPCEFFNMNECIRNYLKVKCPNPINTTECIQQKKFFDDCGDYFTKK